jgi:hypothetical protein
MLPAFYTEADIVLSLWNGWRQLLGIPLESFTKPGWRYLYSLLSDYIEFYDRPPCVDLMVVLIETDPTLDGEARAVAAIALAKFASEAMRLAHVQRPRTRSLGLSGPNN